MVHGATPEDVKKDEEGLQCMRILARNMAYYLKCIEAGKEKGIELPKQEQTIFTNFITSSTINLTVLSCNPEDITFSFAHVVIPFELST